MPGTTVVTVETNDGPISGIIENDIARFLGIPYAAAPVGENRFGAPVPPAPWRDTVLRAHWFGPTPPRCLPDDPPPFDDLLCGAPVEGDDWLNLNVWTGEPNRPSARRPVMVWIHGGYFLQGASAGAAYDGTAFARDGVVLVTVNYRLGVEGFGYLPDAPVPANRGLLDQLCALRWVRDNIARFGGDPGNVTVFGQSAGAISILTLLAGGCELFHRAIVQSGSAHIAQSAEDAGRVMARIAGKLGVEPTCESLRERSPREIAQIQGAVHEDVVTDADAGTYGPTTIASCGMSLLPVLDGDLLDRYPIEGIESGIGGSVPLLIGTNTEEYRFMLMRDPKAYWLPVEPGLRDRLGRYGVPFGTYDRYRMGTHAYPRNYPSAVFCAVATDRLFRISTCRVAEARVDAPAPTYVYELGWRSPVAYHDENWTEDFRLRLGACHCVEIPFVWNNLDAPELLGCDPPKALAEVMHRRWIEFASTGELAGWCPYGRERAVMVFHRDNEPGNVIVHDPRPDERALWTDIDLVAR